MDEGLHLDPPIGLGHRRLSIIDLTDAASEPMTNEDGSLWLVFNGEIYNFRELRKKLEGRHRFRSQGDGETILHLYEEKGDDAVQELDGMFAFALWDAKRRRLLLARDRAGKKPLYYHDGPRVFAFASEVKALFAHPEVPHERDPDALPLFLTYGYVPTPGTFYRGIRSLPPAHSLVVTEAGAEAPRRYWRARFTSGWRNGGDPLAGGGSGPLSDAEAEERFRSLLQGAVERRLVADVPLGAFLSGGLDSSSVVALMARAAGGRVKTFTIGFAGHSEYDEREHAKVVADRFGTDHTEFVVEPKALDLVDRLVFHHDGPFGDSSAVPTYLLSELTRSRVTVALNGDGGDEVFAGYLRLYGGALSERVPRGAFRAAAALLGLLPEPKDRRHPLRFAKRFAEAGSLPLLERYLRLERLLHERPPAAAEAGARAELRARAAARELRDELRRRSGLDARAAAAAQLRDLPARRPAREDGPHVDGARARGALALPRHGGRRVRRGAARSPPHAARQGQAAAAPRDARDPAGVDPDPRQAGVRRAARRLVPERPPGFRARAAARPVRARSTSTSSPKPSRRCSRATARPAPI